MKRILHYLILAIVLLGAPALCAWLGGYDEIWEGVKSFPPRTEDWGFQPEKLWNHRCPFSWPWFIGLSLFTFVCLRPLVKRCLKAAFSRSRQPSSTLHPSPFTFHHSPFVHAFQQMGHDAVFTEVFARHLDSSRLALHPVEEIGVETAVRMQEAIGRGELVLMAGDRVSAGSERVLRHDFLGRPCVWPKGVFVFAKLMESPIFFVTCVRTGWNAYEVHVREFVPSGEPLLQSLLDAYVRFLEEETLSHPEQWYQFYGFFAPPS